MSEKPKVLLIEDHPATRSLVKMILEPEYSVSFAVDGTAGIQQAMMEPPQLIVVDIMMPNVSGWEVIKALRGNPRSARIPILVCTVKDNPADVELGSKLGADDHLTKPFEPKALREKVKKLLEAAAKPTP